MSKDSFSKKRLNRSSKVIIFNKAGEILLVRRGPNDNKAGQWDLPGGGQEVQDRGCRKACAHRESYEETGLKLKKLHLIGTFTKAGDPKKRDLFRAAVNGNHKVKLSDEHDKHQWVRTNRLPNNMHANAEQLIRHNRKHSNKVKLPKKILVLA